MTDIKTQRMDWSDCSDSELLMQFLSRKSDDAFRMLVTRHQGLVMGVCRNILRSTHDAEDAFQATFMILARRAHSIRKQSSIAGWIQRVAFRAALRVAKRNDGHKELPLEAEPDMDDDAFQAIHKQELLCSFHDELSTVPAKLREAIVLVHLEGQSRAEAAEALDCTESALKARLARGRKLLRHRLLRRGIALTVAFHFVAHDKQATAACSDEFIRRTIEIASEFSGGIASASSYQSSTSLPIANNGVRNMFLQSIIKPTVAALAVFAVTALSISLPNATGQTAVTENSQGVDVTFKTQPSSPPEAIFVAARDSTNAERQGDASEPKKDILKRRLDLARERLRASQLELEVASTNDPQAVKALRREVGIAKAREKVLEQELELLVIQAQIDDLTKKRTVNSQSSSIEPSKPFEEVRFRKRTGPRRLSPMTQLQVEVLGPKVGQQKINGIYTVEKSGKLPLGVAYGRVMVDGLTLEEAEKVIIKHLEGKLEDPRVQVTIPSTIQLR